VNVPPAYAQLSILLSLAALLFLVWHIRRAVRGYHHFRDDRAAVTLATSIGSTVVGLGLFISAVGLLINERDFSTVGLSISRGAILIIAAVLVFADVRNPKDG
jgi:hypothetical protein